jgi:hypothetical protein
LSLPMSWIPSRITSKTGTSAKRLAFNPTTAQHQSSECFFLLFHLHPTCARTNPFIRTISYRTHITSVLSPSRLPFLPPWPIPPPHQLLHDGPGRVNQSNPRSITHSCHHYIKKRNWEIAFEQAIPCKISFVLRHHLTAKWLVRSLIILQFISSSSWYVAAVDTKNASSHNS